MDSKTYIANALRTESVPPSVNIEKTTLHAALTLAINAGHVIDQVKRRIFYGTEIDKQKMEASLERVHSMSEYLGSLIGNDMDMDNPQPEEEYAGSLPKELDNLRLDNINVRLLHAALGCFTESGELLEPVITQFEGGELDKTNFGEEVGDIEWYQAIGFDESGVSEASCREKNIAKLRKRYPEKFDAVAAVNRDLAAERAILEDGGATLGPQDK